MTLPFAVVDTMPARCHSCGLMSIERCQIPMLRPPGCHFFRTASFAEHNVPVTLLRWTDCDEAMSTSAAPWPGRNPVSNHDATGSIGCTYGPAVPSHGNPCPERASPASRATSVAASLVTAIPARQSTTVCNLIVPVRRWIRPRPEPRHQVSASYRAAPAHLRHGCRGSLWIPCVVGNKGVRCRPITR
jgi:hypothetical protein